MIVICQSERKSEIRKSGSQVKRHKELRCSPRGEGEEVKERVIGETDGERYKGERKRERRVQIAGEQRRKMWSG